MSCPLPIPEQKAEETPPSTFLNSALFYLVAEFMS